MYIFTVIFWSSQTHTDVQFKALTSASHGVWRTVTQQVRAGNSRLDKQIGRLEPDSHVNTGSRAAKPDEEMGARSVEWLSVGTVQGVHF